MAARAATKGFRLTDMPPEVIQKIAFESRVLSAADVGAMKRTNHSLRDLLGGGNSEGDQVALRKHGRLRKPRGRKRAIDFLVEGNEAEAIFRWKIGADNPASPRNRPLKLACDLGLERAVKYLLTARNVAPWVSAGESKYRNAPLLFAANAGHVEVVRALFDDGRLRFAPDASDDDQIYDMLSVLYRGGLRCSKIPPSRKESILARAVAIARLAILAQELPEIHAKVDNLLHRIHIRCWLSEYWLVLDDARMTPAENNALHWLHDFAAGREDTAYIRVREWAETVWGRVYGKA